MTSRLSAVGSVSIADRIKVFDSGGSRPKSRGTVTPTQPTVQAAKLPPTPLTSQPKSQYSAKDPTSGRQSVSDSGTPSRSSSRNSLAGSESSSVSAPKESGAANKESFSESGSSMVKGVARQDSESGSGSVKGITRQDSTKKSLSRQPSNNSNVTNGKKRSENIGNSKSSSAKSNKSYSPPVDTTTPTPEYEPTKAHATPNTTPNKVKSNSDKLTSRPNVDNITPTNRNSPKAANKKKLNNQRSNNSLSNVKSVSKTEDTVDRSSKLDTEDIIIAEHVKQIENNKINKSSTSDVEHSVSNNNSTVHKNANSNGGDNVFWNNGNVTTSTINGQDEKLSSINSSSEELPSFTSSVTEEIDLVLGGIRGRGLGSLGSKEADLEDQVDELTQQVDMLLKVKSRVESEMASMRKEQKREVADKEDELEDTRVSASKKIKLLEIQLEQEHEERLAYLRERHEMEGRILSLKDALEHGHGEEDVRRLKKELRKTRALLKDAQVQLEKNTGDGMNKIVLRQLKNQLEDAEFARTAAMKARQNCELELADVQTQLEDVSRAKSDLDERCVRLGREKGDVATQLKENEEEMTELIKKYKASVGSSSTDQITLQDQAVNIQQLEVERNRAREQLAEMEQRVDHMKGESVSATEHRRLELKQREMESRLDLEKTGKSRLETQVSRLKEALDKAGKEAEHLRNKDRQQTDLSRKSSKQLREVKEELSTLQGREVEWNQKRLDLEKQLELVESETVAVRSDLKLASRRVEDLQAAIQGDMDSETDITSSDLEAGETDDEDGLSMSMIGRLSKNMSTISLDRTSSAVSSLPDTPRGDSEI